MNAYGKGRIDVINEIRAFIDKEIESISKERKSISKDTKDAMLTHKRATLSGANRQLHRLLDLLDTKEENTSITHYIKEYHKQKQII